jgi:site-specific DNA-methyltransferase (adenine-specific)
MTEYILIFRKPGPTRIYEGRSREEKEENRIELDSVTTRDVANNVWHVAPVPPRQLNHPCPFPEEIPYRIIRWYSYKGDLVLDPFCGIGTTLKVAASLGRQWVGYEIVEKYAALAEKRVREPLVLRKQLLVAYDKLEYGEKTSPKNKPRAPFRGKGRQENTIF